MSLNSVVSRQLVNFGEGFVVNAIDNEFYIAWCLLVVPEATMRLTDAHHAFGSLGEIGDGLSRCDFSQQQSDAVFDAGKGAILSHVQGVA